MKNEKRSAIRESRSLGAVIAIDPGREKCGVAVVFETGAAPERRVVRAAELASAVSLLAARYGIGRVVLGTGTSRAQAAARIREVAEIDEIVEVNEAFSTLEARAIYWRQNPPRGIRRLIPRSLLVPPEPYDDLTAWVLGTRYWQAMKNEK